MLKKNCSLILSLTHAILYIICFFLYVLLFPPDEVFLYILRFLHSFSFILKPKAHCIIVNIQFSMSTNDYFLVLYKVLNNCVCILFRLPHDCGMSEWSFHQRDDISTRLQEHYHRVGYFHFWHVVFSTKVYSADSCFFYLWLFQHI